MKKRIMDIKAIESCLLGILFSSIFIATLFMISKTKIGIVLVTCILLFAFIKFIIFIFDEFFTIEKEFDDQKNKKD